jgi:hypothetical protein
VLKDIFRRILGQAHEILLKIYAGKASKESFFERKIDESFSQTQITSQRKGIKIKIVL